MVSGTTLSFGSSWTLSDYSPLWIASYGDALAGDPASICPGLEAMVWPAEFTSGGAHVGRVDLSSS